MTDIPVSSASTPSVPSSPEEWRALVAGWRAAAEDRTADHAALIGRCVARLRADPAAPSAPAWPLGIMIIASALEGRALPAEAAAPLTAALGEVSALLSARPCDHDEDGHPYLAEFETDDDAGWRFDLPETALRIAGAAGGLDDPGRWRCPRNTAGLARAASETFDPGTFDDVPVAPPENVEWALAGLSDVLFDHPYDDPAVTLRDHAGYLRSAALVADASLPCHLIANYALAWYAASERVTDPALHDEIITAFEAAADRLGDPGPCDHAAHPRLGQFEDYLPTAAWLETPLGRRAYQWRRREEGGEPLDAWLCPAFLRAKADEALAALRPARAAAT
ncbi:hypothetical protein ACSNOI_45155, partial [Actinomadura kijaniata]|uniref:hypothetical protein n=1 Tax=Actinomadura kijaniata TaxID=46161 RepID=UPI003F1D5047